MVYPYDNPEQWQAGFPAGWNPQAVLMQALQMQPGGPPVMPQATRGGIQGLAESSLSGYTPSTLSAPQMQAAPQATQGGGYAAPPGPAYYGPTHQALSTALQGALGQQAQVPGLLNELKTNGNWEKSQAIGGLMNNVHSPSHAYNRLDYFPDDPNNNAQVHMLNQARQANTYYGTPIPPGLEEQVLARQQAAAAAPAPQAAAPAASGMTPEMQAYLLAQMQQQQAPAPYIPPTYAATGE